MRKPKSNQIGLPLIQKNETLKVEKAAVEADNAALLREKMKLGTENAVLRMEVRILVASAGEHSHIAELETKIDTLLKHLPKEGDLMTVLTNALDVLGNQLQDLSGVKEEVTGRAIGISKHKFHLETLSMQLANNTGKQDSDWANWVKGRRRSRRRYGRRDGSYGSRPRWAEIRHHGGKMDIYRGAS